MRAIDADHLKRWILSRVFETQLSVADVIDQIDREDTIEPEIVRCKDCTKRKICRTSTTWAVAPKDDWYCADAERRTDEGD